VRLIITDKTPWKPKLFALGTHLSLPLWAQGLPAGALLIGLAFVRTSEPAAALGALLDPDAHGYVLLLVPLIPTALLLSVLTTVLFATRPRWLARAVMLGLVVVVIAAPALSTAVQRAQLRAGLALSAEAVAPLTPTHHHDRALRWGGDRCLSCRPDHRSCPRGTHGHAPGDGSIGSRVPRP